MDQELLNLLEQGFNRMRRQGWIVSSITIGLAAFMTSLYWLDPEVPLYSTAMIAVYVTVVLFFYAVGFYMLYVALVRSTSQKTELFRILQQQPMLIKKVYHFRVISKASDRGSPNPVGSQHYIRIEQTNGKTTQLSYPFQHIAMVLDKIHKHIPHSRL